MKGDRGAPRGERNKQKDEGGEERRKRLGEFFFVRNLQKRGSTTKDPFFLSACMMEPRTRTYA